MKAVILHESRGRIRFRIRQDLMTLRQADLLEAWLKSRPWAATAAVHERTCCAVIYYTGKRSDVISDLCEFTWAEA